MRAAQTLWRAAALLGVALTLAALPIQASVKAWLDNTEVAPGDTVQLTLEHDGQSGSQPDLTPLKQDFDILGTSSSTNMQIINGTPSVGTELALVLQPKRTGHLIVPSILWDGDRTTALGLNVTASAGHGGSADGSAIARRVFLETQVDPKRPYVQAAVRVTVRIYAAEPLYHANLDFPGNDEAVIRQIGSDETGSAERDGRVFHVVTRHFLVFPQRSGSLHIPGAVLSGNIAVRPDRSNPLQNDPFSGFFSRSPFGGMLSSTKPIRVNGEAVELDVQPRPASASSSYWLPARQVALTADWTPDRGPVHAGEPITLNLHLQADGLTAAQLPDLSALLSLPDGIKAYPDQPKLEDPMRGDLIAGTREQSIALIADRPGQFTIPSLHLSWWDTASNVEHEVTLPERTFTILPAPGAAPQPSTRSPASNPVATRSPAGLEPGNAHPGFADGGPWRWVSLALALLWLGTLGAWMEARRRRASTQPPPDAREEPSSPNASRAQAAFKQACRANDPRAARQFLLAWAAATWPDAPPAGLNALAKRLGDAALAALFRDLDRACYAGGSWRGDALAAALSDLRPARASKPANTGSDLAPLYP